MKPAPFDPVEHALWQYAGLAHGPSASSPFDWQRFYKFIVLAHARRKAWDAADVRKRLRDYGFSVEKAEEMAEVYWHGRCVLHVRKQFGRWIDYTGWVKKGGEILT